MEGKVVYEVTKKLIGPINPIGDSSVDAERLKNLDEMIVLLDQLMFDMRQVAQNATRQEASMKKAGERAKNFIYDS